MSKANVCYHCGADCGQNPVKSFDKYFCCNGCKIAYEILGTDDLCQYYDLESTPGNIPVESGHQHRYAYLDDEDIQKSLIHFKDNNISKITFNIPGMHCASCVWILERLYKIRPEITHSTVDFLKNECAITYKHDSISLREIVELLISIGYEPHISFQSISENIEPAFNRTMIMKLGVAGFSFGNIMLFSFPEYFSPSGNLDGLQQFFRYLNIVLALPVLFYSSTDYFRSAFLGIKKRFINIDIPIAIGIIALFSRSAYEILFGVGPGFMDSFTGLVFLLLLGKIFQQKSFDSLSFERDYKSYFPLAVMKNTPDGEQSIPLAKLNVGDRIIIRNGELIPADSILLKNDAQIDYSFVTGESKAKTLHPGDTVYAGGRLVGAIAEAEVVKSVSQSYLTQLWNQEDKTAKATISSTLDTVSKYFTMAVLTIASFSGLYWLMADPTKTVHVITSILIVACPCALALSAPFTLGNTIRIFGRKKFYLKNADVVEKLSKISHIVFDKTGTITHSGQTDVTFVSADKTAMSTQNKNNIISLAANSSHPLSRHIVNHFNENNFSSVSKYEEIPGKGIFGVVNGNKIMLGSADFCGIQKIELPKTSVQITINDVWIGYFLFTNQYRKGLSKIIESLKKRYGISILTGDNDSEADALTNIFGKTTNVKFNQSPFDKKHHIQDLQSKGEIVAMIGDGLNDAGALESSNVGISISDDIYLFSPASDTILESGAFHELSRFLSFSSKAMYIIYASIFISLLYNVVGLTFAVQGLLSPVISAILMPISSISVIAFSTGSVRFLLRR